MREGDFPPKVKRQAWRDSKGYCAEGCYIGGKPCHYDHKKPLWAGGDNSLHNCQVLCVYHHMMKTGEEAAPRAKVNRITNKAAGIGPQKKRSMPGSRSSKWKRRLDGTIEER